MENKEEKRFTKKHGAVLMLSLCLVGAVAFATFYTLNVAEKTKEQEEQFVELEEEQKIQDANAAKNITAKEGTTEDAGDKASIDGIGEEAQANGSVLANEIDEDPADLAKNGQTEGIEAAGASSGKVEAEIGTGLENAVGTVDPTVNFNEDSNLEWPVAGNVLLDYSMDGSIFFPTLKVYKYNPALVIGAEVGSQVSAAAKGIVDSIDVDEETGTTITMNVGNNYKLVYGQLKEVPVSVGELVEEGEILGYVSEPTKYYCEEGSNLYFKMMKDGEPVDPFLYLE